MPRRAYIIFKREAEYLGSQVLLILNTYSFCAYSLSGCPQKDKLTPESKYYSIKLITSYCSYIVHLLFARVSFSLSEARK